MLQNPQIIPAPWANNGDKAHIPLLNAPLGRATWSEGWSPVNSQPLNAGGIPPNRLDFNAALYALSAHAFWQQSGGMYAWNAELDYVPTCHVWYAEVLWVAVGNSGPGYGGAVAPGSDESRWRTFADYVVGAPDFANVRLDNLAAAGSARMAASSMPGSFISITLPNGGTYTAPEAGWVCYNRAGTGDEPTIVGLENVTKNMVAGAFAMGGQGVSAILAVTKGDVIKNVSTATGTVYYSYFYYAKG